MKTLFEKDGIKMTDDDIRKILLPCAVVNLFERETGWYSGPLSVQIVLPEEIETDEIELTVGAADYDSTEENFPALMGTSIKRTVPTQEFCETLVSVKSKQNEPYLRYLLPFVRDYLLTFVKDQYKFWHRELDDEISLEELWEEVKEPDNESLFKYVRETYG